MLPESLTRVRELVGLVPTAQLFRDFETKIQELPQRRRHYWSIEAALQRLDENAWSSLKPDPCAALTTPLPDRMFQNFLDRLNEARAYGYLLDQGYSNVRFVHRGQRKTPDLEARNGDQLVLCEAKTVNRSAIEMERQKRGGVLTVERFLPAGFFKKLDSTIHSAVVQMNSYCSTGDAIRIVYLRINFDDRLHEYADDYEVQIAKHMKDQALDGVHVVADWDPPFANAMI